MPRILPLALLALLLVTPAVADEAAEKAALKKVEKELLDLGKFAAKGNDGAAAEAALRLALEVLPESEKVRAELEKLEKKPPRGAPKEGFAEKLAERRAAAHREAALALADAALATEATAPERYARYVRLIQERLPEQEALTRLDLVYFAPYLRWVSGTEAKLLQAGGEVMGDRHVEADAVAALDRQHATWSDPWVVGDDVHEVRTTMPLRTANQILAFVGAYRRHFLERFGGAWGLKAPAGKLPIVLTRTQAELKEQLTKVAGSAAPPGGVQGAAFYLMTNSALNPCFVTYEPLDATGVMFKVERFDQLVIPLIHEVTHQLAFEYSKHDYDRSRMIQHQFWAVEGIANFMCYHVLEDGRWRLTRPRTIPMGQGMIEGPFAWCLNNRASLPPLARFMGQSQQEFMTVQNYHIAATLSWFLLEGEGGKYRAGFVKLLEAVHRVHDGPDTFGKSFPGVDLSTMEQEFERFVEKIELDP